MNLPNLLTLVRMPLTFAIVALMYGRWTGAAVAALGLFIVAGLTDWLDGKLARERGIVSNFGKFMDALTDKMLVLGIMVALLDLDYLRLPGVLMVLLVLVVIMREFLVSGLRMIAAAQGVVMAAERGGKIKTVIQMVSLGFLLLEPALEYDVATWWPAAEEADVWEASIAGVHHTGVILFFVSMWFTVSSMANYFRKYHHLLMEDA